MPANMAPGIARASRYVAQRPSTGLRLYMSAAFALPLLLYVATLAPTVYGLDSAELTTAAATGGIMRATGYPLYLLLGNFWSRLPLGDVGYRMNLFSAVCGALTIGLLAQVLRRLGVGMWAAAGALGLLATAHFFWALSLIAEVYTLHTALMAALLLLLLRWRDDPRPARLAVIALPVGLSLGHHAATTLLLPGIAWYLLTTAPRRTLAAPALFPALAALLVGLSVYLYLPLRYLADPVFNYAGQYDAAGLFHPTDLSTPGGLWWLLSGRVFADDMLAYSRLELWAESIAFGRQLWAAFFAVGIGPGLLGAFVLLRRHWQFGGMLLMMFVCNAAFYINYRVVDKDTMFLPTYVVWAIWIAVGYQWVIDWTAGIDEARYQRWTLAAARTVMLLAVAGSLGWNWRLVDRSADWSGRERGERILRQVQPGALILGWWETVPPVQYLQLVEGQRPDVQALNRFLISHADLLVLARREAARRPVYIDSLPADLPPSLEVRQAGPLYRLIPVRGRGAPPVGRSEQR